MADLFSPEALRLLELASATLAPPSQGPETVEFEELSKRVFLKGQTSAGLKRQRIERCNKETRGPPGYFCFPLDGNVPRPAQRARFSDSRKKEVNETRKRGACIRCQLLKRTVSLLF